MHCDVPKILKKLGNSFKSLVQMVLDFIHSLSLPSVLNAFQTHYFLKAESTGVLSSRFFNNLPVLTTFRVSLTCVVPDYCRHCIRRQVCILEMYYGYL